MKDKIPSQYDLLGQTYTVSIVPKEDWTDQDIWGEFIPMTNEVRILQLVPSRVEQTFYHELVHSILTVMGHKLNSDEVFVDTFAGLLHQAIKSSK